MLLISLAAKFVNLSMEHGNTPAKMRIMSVSLSKQSENEREI